MAKQVLTNGYVLINGVDLSDHAFAIDTPDSKNQVDVSGFSATGYIDTLPGQRTQQLTVSFLQDYATGKVHQTLQPLYEAASAFTFTVAPNGSSISATNPKWSGTAELYEYDGLNGQLNNRLEIVATFRPVAGGPWQWATA